MEEEKKLYPFKFCTLQDDYSWGSEEFKLADLGYRDSLVREGWLAGNSISEVMDTYIDRVVGDKIYDYYGRQFPVCIRKMDVKGKMPLRVHPGEEIAAQRYDFLGKEKLWYIEKAAAGSSLMIGFKRQTDASEVFARCSDGSIEGILNVVEVQDGQSFRIPAGMPHAASGDMQIIEIAESSPLDFCLCGWGKEVSTDEFDPALSLADALDFIDYGPFKVPGQSGDGLLVNLPQLSVKHIDLDDPLLFSNEDYDSFILFTCVRGKAAIQMKIQELMADYHFAEAETLLVPAECPDFALIPEERGTLVLETTVHREDKDPYINPDVPAHLPEDF